MLRAANTYLGRTRPSRTASAPASPRGRKLELADNRDDVMLNRPVGHDKPVIAGWWPASPHFRWFNLPSEAPAGGDHGRSDVSA